MNLINFSVAVFAAGGAFFYGFFFVYVLITEQRIARTYYPSLAILITLLFFAIPNTHPLVDPDHLNHLAKVGIAFLDTGAILLLLFNLIRIWFKDEIRLGYTVNQNSTAYLVIRITTAMSGLLVIGSSILIYYDHP